MVIVDEDHMAALVVCQQALLRGLRGIVQACGQGPFRITFDKKQKIALITQTAVVQNWILIRVSSCDDFHSKILYNFNAGW